MNENELLMVMAPGAMQFNQNARIVLLATKENKNTTYKQAINDLLEHTRTIGAETSIVNSETITINNCEWMFYETETPSIGSYALYYFFKQNDIFYTFSISTNRIDYQLPEKET
ncbi:MAG: hypothetical protein U9N85_11010 [Bacteroidota bacterium]|nr:hypothetical protein [Bacteroidota bacterium]